MHFQNAIFAGGGSRCLWQVGFWDGANEAGLGLDTSVNYAAGTSAGCAMALVVSLGRGPEALALFKKLTAANPANIHCQNLKPGSGKPLFPHLRIYRQALEEFLMPDDLKNLEGKQLEFLMARFPRY
ncbi:patatin-like phospholipase family protein, partial [Luminiphilus sp.]|nr:patatin-like phospholipase family protein [Luminiphilus sp.]